MKNSIICGTTIFAVILLATQVTQAQGIVYLSNSGQPSAGSVAVGSNSWTATPFIENRIIG